MIKKLKRLYKKELVKIASGAVLFAAALVLELLGQTVAAICGYAVALVIAGGGVFAAAIRGVLRGDLLDEKFLMCIAAIGAMIIGEYREGVAVMLFFLIGEYFEHKAVRKSRGTIKSLMDIRPDGATLLREGEEAEVDADELSVGDTIIIRSGERCAADAEIISGSAYVDTTALTGESVPFAVSEGDVVRSGSVIIGGFVTARVIKTADESSAQRILDLVENGVENKSREENFITAFSHYYTPAVVILALLMATIPSIFGLTSWSESIYRALTFLVISCPCALVISVPMAFFGGIGAAASEGVLFKGGSRFSSVARADTVVFDKTGTLTEGRLSVSEVKGFGMEESELISLAASAEYASLHPIAEAIRAAAGKIYPAENVRDIAGKGTVAIVNGSEIAVGNAKLMADIGVCVNEGAGVFVAVSGALAGIIRVSDTVKPEAKEAILELSRLGVKNAVILSGDGEENVRSVAGAVGIKTAYSALLPEEKYSRLEELIKSSRSVIYVGDGINDAPSLSLADAGIAMGAIGSDHAIEAADVVIMSDRLTKIARAVRISRKTIRIAKENIVFALGVKLGVLILSAFGIANMWLAVFADVGVAVIAILNAMRALRTGGKSR